MNITSLKQAYEQQGHAALPVVLSESAIAACRERMKAVLQGSYQTGIQPKRVDWRPGDDELMIRRVEQAHWADQTIMQTISTPALAELVAEMTGAEALQIWNVQLLQKPSGNTSFTSHVGWHQDSSYWPMWEGEVFTVWLALSDVQANSGPIRYVDGSHHWGALSGSDFWFEGELDDLKAQLPIPADAQWCEHAAVLPPGAATMHHKYTMHGSAANSAGHDRWSFAIHFRTEKARYLPEADPDGAVTHLHDFTRCPVVYGDAGKLS